MSCFFPLVVVLVVVVAFFLQLVRVLWQVELDSSIKRLSVVAAAPELYPALVDAGAVTSLLGLLTHENTVSPAPPQARASGSRRTQTGSSINIDSIDIASINSRS